MLFWTWILTLPIFFRGSKYFHLGLLSPWINTALTRQEEKPFLYKRWLFLREKNVLQAYSQTESLRSGDSWSFKLGNVTPWEASFIPSTGNTRDLSPWGSALPGLRISPSQLVLNHALGFLCISGLSNQIINLQRAYLLLLESLADSEQLLHTGHEENNGKVYVTA